jgi:hypothetical protein
MARAFDWDAAKLPAKMPIERRPVPRLTDRQMGRSKTPPAAVRHYRGGESRLGSGQPGHASPGQPAAVSSILWCRRWPALLFMKADSTEHCEDTALRNARY